MLLQLRGHMKYFFNEKNYHFALKKYFFTSFLIMQEKNIEAATLHNESVSQEEDDSLPQQERLIDISQQLMKQAAQMLRNLNLANVTLDQQDIKSFTVINSLINVELKDLLERSNVATLRPLELIANKMSDATDAVFNACETFKSVLIDFEEPPYTEDIQEADNVLSDLTSVIGELFEKADLHEELETKIEDLVGQISALTDRKIIINDDQ